MNQPKHPRLLLVLSTFPQLSETFIVSKFLGLLERGWDVHILCTHFNPPAWDQFPGLRDHPQARKHVHTALPTQPRWMAPLHLTLALTACLATTPRRTWRYLRMGWKRFGWGIFKRFYLDAPLIRLKPNLLHFEFGALAVGRTYLKSMLDVKLSVSFRGYDLNFVALDDPNYYDGLWKALDGCHLLSKYLWQKALARGCAVGMNHQLIPPAVDLRGFPEAKRSRDYKLGRAEKPLRILSVGRLAWKKGYEHALQAIWLLLKMGVLCEYHVVGEGEYRDALYFARHQMDLEDTVTFCGPLEHPAVLEKCAWADVFLHPSLSEGFCNAVLEAQALGVPVVCTDAGGLPENVADGVTGFVVPRRDPAALAEKLALLAGEPTLRATMGAAGCRRVEAHFRMAQQLDAFEDFYAGL